MLKVSFSQDWNSKSDPNTKMDRNMIFFDQSEISSPRQRTIDSLLTSAVFSLTSAAFCVSFQRFDWSKSIHFDPFLSFDPILMWAKFVKFAVRYKMN